MSDSRGKTPRYEVGYAKPPAEHRFKPGRSGNPRGRPKKVKPTQAEQFARSITDEIRAESQRIISVREGDKIVDMTLTQYLTRGLLTDAAKGDPGARKLALKLIGTVEEQDKRDRMQLFEEAAKRKSDWERYTARCAREGITPEEPLTPHPDDIILDLRTAEVVIIGPMTREDKLLMDELIKRRDKFIADLNEPAAWSQFDPDVQQRVRDFLKKKADEINDRLPPRCRRQVEVRCFENEQESDASD